MSDDDVPDELWDMLDTISHQKNQTVSQAPALFGQQQQPHHNQPVPLTTMPSAPSSNAQWRPQLVQQLPSAPPSKPRSLGQQLMGGGGGLPQPGGGVMGGGGAGFHPGGTTPQHHQQQQRWPPPLPQQQQQQPPWGAPQPQFQQQQQQPGARQWGAGGAAAGPSGGGDGGATDAAKPSPADILAAGLGLPPLRPTSATQGGGQQAPPSSTQAPPPPAQLAVPPPPAPAGQPPPLQPAAAMQQQPPAMQQQPPAMQQPPPAMQQQLDRMQNDLQQQASEANQLRMKLMDVEREKQQLQARLNTQPQNSMAQARAQDLQKLVHTYQQQLLFAETETREARDRATAKDSRAAQAEAQLKALQDDVRRKEEQLQQLAVELEQEKQRTERLAATAAAGGGGGGVTHLATPARTAGGARTPGGAASSSARKRRGSGNAAATPGPLQAAQLTPQQQRQRQQEVGNPLGDGPEDSSIDLDMYEGVDEEQPPPPLVQQQQQQAPAPPQQQPAVPAAAAAAHAATAAVQPPPPAAAAATTAVVQHPPSSSSSSSVMAGRLIPALQRVQVSQPQLPQLVWSTCQPALQQLLQPLPAPLLGLSSSTARGLSAKCSLHDEVPALLAAVQQQLNALTAGGSSNAGTLLLGLLQLAAALVPQGAICTGSEAAALLAGGQDAAAAAAMQAAFPGAGDAQQQPRWLLLPEPVADSGGDSSPRSPPPRGQQQQQAHFLVFRAAGDAQALHVLPLQLAAAVLHVAHQLVRFDSACLFLAVTQLGCARDDHSSAALLQQLQGGADGDSNTSSRRVQVVGAAPGARAQHQRHQGVVSLRAQQAPGAGRASPGSGSGSSGSVNSSSCEQHGGLLELLSAAAGCHGSLQQEVATLLATLAERLPLQLRTVLLPLLSQQQPLLSLLLQAEGAACRSQAAALLQALLACPAVVTELAASVKRGAGGGAAEQRAAAEEDIIMIDVTDADAAPAGTTALQPLNHRAPRAASAAGSKAPSKPSGQQQRQQQQAVNGGEASAGSSKQPPAAAPAAPVVSAQVVQDVLLTLLDCFAFNLEAAFQQQRQQPASVSSGWGVFELQRRCCGAVAALLHSKQEVLLGIMLDLQATAGYGLAQRLLTMVDAACSPLGGDPFAALLPLGPPGANDRGGSSSRATAASSSIVGARCSLPACMARLQLCHEGLLLLRALVASDGLIGERAKVDLCSNTPSIRLIMTTRAKLAETTEALLAAARQPAGTVAGRPAAAAPAAGAPPPPTGLPLQPWAWPWSAHCGCRLPGQSSGSSSSVGERQLHVEGPALQTVLQEMANSAASVHRRVMIFMRAHDSAMPS